MKIYLAMIVKNEAARIERALRSAAPIISGGIITDTGSTDDTLKIIERLGQELKLTFTITHAPFENFEQARNANLDAAVKQLSVSDYLLLMDADMELRVKPEFDSSKLTADGYLVMQVAGSMNYMNMRMLKVGVPARYIGVTHEYLSLNGKTEPLHTLWFQDYADGTNRLNKADRDIQLFRKAMQGLTGRYMFYMAQSFKDQGNNQEALTWYDARVSLGGWDEETWYAAYMGAIVCHSLNRQPEAIVRALKAARLRPKRAESWALLAKLYREQNMHEDAYIAAKTAVACGRCDDMLFVNNDAYTFNPLFEISVAGYYTKDPTIKAEAKRAGLDLLTMRIPDPTVYVRVRQNAEHYVPMLNELLPHAIIKKMEWGLKIGEWREGNSCIINTDDGGYEYTLRLSNYWWKQPDRIVCCILPNSQIDIRNYMMTLDQDFNVTRTPVQLPTHDAALTWSANHGTPIEVYEDLRIFRYRGATWAIGTAVTYGDHGGCRTVLFRLSTDWKVIDNLMLLPSLENRAEKNWVPVVAGDSLRIVYWWDPFILLDINVDNKENPVNAVQRTYPKINSSAWRGSSPLLPYDTGYLAVVHEHLDYPDKRRHYLHRLVWLDKNLTLQKYTDPFYFALKGIQFCMGLAYHKYGLVASISLVDAQSAFCFIPGADLDKAWKHV